MTERSAHHSFVVHVGAGEPGVLVQDLASLQHASLRSVYELPGHLHALLEGDRHTRERRARYVRQARFARLTSRESTVAALAVAGLSNRQIGEALELRPRTVESHLTAAYRKLGIKSRRELEGALRADVPS